MHGPPNRLRRNAVPPASGTGPNRKTTPVKTFKPRSGHSASEKWKNFPLHAVVAQLRDDPTLPIRLRMRALQASHRLRCGGDLDHDTARELYHLHAQRRRQLADLARRYGAPR